MTISQPLRSIFDVSGYQEVSKFSKFYPVCFSCKVKYLWSSLLIHILVFCKINIQLSPNFWIWIFHCKRLWIQKYRLVYLNTTSNYCPIIDVRTIKSSGFPPVCLPFKMQYLFSYFIVRVRCFRNINFKSSVNFWI